MGGGAYLNITTNAGCKKRCSLASARYRLGLLRFATKRCSASYLLPYWSYSTGFYPDTSLDRLETLLSSQF